MHYLIGFSCITIQMAIIYQRNKIVDGRTRCHVTQYVSILTGGNDGRDCRCHHIDSGGMHWYHQSQLTITEEQLMSPESLLVSFQRTYARDVSDNADEYIVSVWQRIRDYLPISLQENASIPKVSTPNDIQPLLDILHKEIPFLRRKSSPNHFGSPPN